MFNNFINDNSSNQATNIAVNEIKPNDINPNDMTSSQFDRLKKSIQEIGVLTPIIVRPINKEGVEYKYEIVDGEHRWKACVENGKQFIPAFVRDMTDMQMNEVIMTTALKGKFNSKKNARFAKSISDSIKSGETTHEKTGMTKTLLQKRIGYAHVTSMINSVREFRDETESKDVVELTDFKAHLIIALKPDAYKQVAAKLDAVNSKEWDKALLQIMGVVCE